MSILPGNKIQLADLISNNRGKKIEIYSCGYDNTNCLYAGNNTNGIKKVEIIGIKQQIEDMLIGSSRSMGIIKKFAFNYAGGLTQEEKNFMTNLPVGIGTIVRNLSMLSEEAATLFAIESSGAIALVMIHSFINEVFRAALIAMANSDNAYKRQAIDVLRESQENMKSEYTTLVAQYGDLASQLEKYNSFLNNIRKHKYMLATLSKAPHAN